MYLTGIFYSNKKKKQATFLRTPENFFNIETIQLHKHFQKLEITEMQIALLCLVG